eukprot:3185831-Amphidinium_carterae.1
MEAGEEWNPASQQKRSVGRRKLEKPAVMPTGAFEKYLHSWRQLSRRLSCPTLVPHSSIRSYPMGAWVYRRMYTWHH